MTKLNSDGLKEKALAAFVALAQKTINFVFTEKCWDVSVEHRLREVLNSYQSLVNLGFVEKTEGFPMERDAREKLIDQLALEVIAFRNLNLTEEGRKELYAYFQNLTAIELPVLEPE